MLAQSGRRDLTRPAASAAGAWLSPASGAKAPQAPKLNPRPPEPHAGQESYSKRQLVGFSMASERRRRVPLVEMSGDDGRNGTRNGTTFRRYRLSRYACNAHAGKRSKMILPLTRGFML